jgi:hypothetical protein
VKYLYSLLCVFFAFNSWAGETKSVQCWLKEQNRRGVPFVSIIWDYEVPSAVADFSDGHWESVSRVVIEGQYRYKDSSGGFRLDFSLADLRKTQNLQENLQASLYVKRLGFSESVDCRATQQELQTMVQAFNSGKL